MPDAVLVYEHGKMVFCSEKALEYFGASSPDDLLGLGVMDVTHPDESENVVRRLKFLQNSADGTIPTERIQLKRLDGTYFFADLSARLVRGDEGTYLVGVIRDVTQQFEMEKKLAVSEQNYRSIFEQAEDGIYLFDPETNKITDTNRAGASMLGYSPNELIGMELKAFSTSKGGEEERLKRTQKMLAGEVLPLRESLHIKKDGSTNPVEVNGNLVQHDGRVLIQFTVRDITERKAAEKARQENEDRFRDFANSAADRFWETDENHKYTYLSPPAGEMRRPTETLIGESPWGVKSREHSTEHDLAIQAAFESEKPFRNVRNIGTTPDGKKRFMALNAIPYLDEKNNFAGFRGSTTDETDEVEARENANLARVQFHDAIEHLPDSIVVYDSNLLLVACNSQAKLDHPQVAHLMKPGTPLKDVVEALHDGSIVPETDDKYSHLQEKVDTVREKGLASNVVKISDGRWMMISRYRTAEGGMLVHRTDITERKMAEDALKASEARFRDYGTISSDWFWEMDENLKFSYFSDNLTEITGLVPEGLLGKTRQESGLDMSNRHVRQNIEDIEARRPFKDFEHSRTLDDGRVVYISSAGLPIFDANGEFQGYRGTGRDITESKLAILALEQARGEAELANRAKSEFLSSMSHELRTPMNAIMGFGQLLSDNPADPLTDKQHGYAQHILKGGHHLLDLIDQVLELSKIEAGQLSISIENVVYDDVIHECIKFVEAQARANQVDLNVVALTFKPPLLRTDRSRLGQVLLNLLSNAIKYNQFGGKVSISTSLVRTDFLRFSVVDTGLGIPKQKQEHIFEPFNRLGREAGDIQGTGIGLTITKQIIDLMGGYIGFESEEDVGSTFWIDIPIASESDGNEDITDTSNLVNIAPIDMSSEGVILYVEDNPANLRLMEAVIDRFDGMTLKSAINAEIGIGMAREILPDLILMDINLPGMDGIEALSQLRKDEKTKGIPVIAITAAAMPHEKELGVKVGFEAYITKPINVPEVLEAISDFIEQ
jgi:PAS domain S-box-containing protein